MPSQTQTVDACPTIKQLNHLLDAMSRVERVGLATVIQKIRVLGFGNLNLVDAILASHVWLPEFTVSLPFKKEEVIAKLYFVATNNSCHIGHDLTVDQVHYNFLNKGIVV